jgi:3-deoxy-D-manno-octulosonic-acid transferase
VSTHDGEEAVAGEVHALLRSRHPGLLTIVVPRHPERAEAIVKALVHPLITYDAEAGTSNIPASEWLLVTGNARHYQRRTASSTSRSARSRS